MNFKSLFSGKKDNIYGIEKGDTSISKQAYDMLLKAEGHMKELKAIILTDNIILKDAKLAELENSLLLMKSKVETLRMDVKRIMDIEVQNRDIITIHDDQYLEDKYNRLGQMSEALEDLTELLRQRPTSPDLRREFMGFIYGKMNVLADSMNNIITDDKNLEQMYSKLAAM